MQQHLDAWASGGSPAWGARWRRRTSGGSLVRRRRGDGARSSSPRLFAGASVVEVGSGSTHVELTNNGASGARRCGRRNLRPRNLRPSGSTSSLSQMGYFSPCRRWGCFSLCCRREEWVSGRLRHIIIDINKKMRVLCKMSLQPNSTRPLEIIGGNNLCTPQ